MSVPQLLLDQRTRLEPNLAKIGDTWEDMVEIVEWTTNKRIFLPPTRALGAVANPEKNIVIWGECDSYRGLEELVTLLELYKEECILIISGGNYKRQTHGEAGALELWLALESRLQTSGWRKEDIDGLRSTLIIDSFSHHTGHQRRLIASIVREFEPEVTIPVLPRCHITRFMMSLGRNIWKESKGPRAYGYPVVLPLPHGQWGTYHTGRGPIDNPTRTFTYAELLALPPMQGRNPETLICGEIDKIIQYASPNERQCLTFRQAREWLKI